MKPSIIRSSRKRLGLSVTDLAAKMNVGISAAWAWDRGESIPHTKRIAALASILHLDADELRLALKGDQVVVGAETSDLKVAAVLEAAKLHCASLLGRSPQSITLTLSVAV